VGIIASLSDPNIAKYLLREEGEVIVDEVRRHWAAYMRPIIETLIALPLLGFSPFVNVNVAWLMMIVGFGLLLHSIWRALREHRDRFVITNMRVFRVKGVLTSNLATMPLHRILDITVKKSFLGRIFGFGHFVFESAAQEQGLRDIRYVGHADERDKAIQRVVQRSGLRGPRIVN
jgi:uncharacterized membrane protein YdbT with pleckstrin-like domain